MTRIRLSRMLAARALTLVPAIAMQALAISAAVAQTATETPPFPTLTGPIAVTPTSHPYLAAPAAMNAAGYVEEEYFLKGKARTYDWVGTTRDVKAIAGPSPYVTRILVRRPHDPKRFSGRIEVTILNGSTGADLGGPTDFHRMTEHGDAWIGITSKALTARALKHFDPVRYAPLDWSNPAPEAQRCDQPSIIPIYSIGGPKVMEMMAKSGFEGSFKDKEDGLIWDMLAQLARLLKSDARTALLPDSPVPRLYMTGVSQSALMIRTWAIGFHDHFRLPDGKPLYDGYLEVVGPAMLRINQCAADVLPDDPRQKLVPPDVPYISLSTEGENWLSRYTRQPDAIKPHSGLVSYVVTGASHARTDVPGVESDHLGRASPEDVARTDPPPSDASMLAKMIPPGFKPNTFPWAPVVRATFINLQQWAEHAVEPPQAPTLQLNAKLEIRRDTNGNALGGLRLPYIVAPTATHRGAVSSSGPGSIFGVEKPFTSATLKALYPTHADYVAKFSAATDKLLAARFLLPADAIAMKSAAEAASIPQ